MARYLAKIVYLGAQVVGRALVKTLRQEIEVCQEAARIQETLRANAPSDRDVAVKGMTLVEAQQILNVKDLSDRQAIEAHYQHLFRANDKNSGGTFYIQSKVFRAKERIDQELAQTHDHRSASSTAPSQSQFQTKEPVHKDQ
ncbi:mitochondrial import inner membrane translocase subunit tim16 [Drosophila elegans]|uniref:mitochondrial import inner membrane translocase subunit tim16 n=1 Tax=Drosophila elegans TaxID=30023 RepID=UPI0007E696E8|nr:mitochondrial import inner membrane translocase subunit tim16 [Drosophila elegans]